VLAAAQLVIALDFNIVYVALPGIGQGLGFSGQSLQWVVSAYVVATGGLLLLGGRVTDLLGRRVVFVVAAGVYGVSSLVGGFAESAGVLVAMRALQGVGGALLFPATLALLNTLFAEGPERNRALAVWGAAGAGGMCFGSLLGGVLVDAFGWPSVFFVNVPLAGGIALAGRLLFPPDPARTPGRRFDVAGALTATGGITLLVLVLVQGPDAGWGSPAVVLGAVASVLLLAAFAFVERRGGDPLVPFRLLSHPGLVPTMFLAFVYSATFSSLPYFLTLYFQGVRDYSAFATGLAFLVPAVVVAVGARVGERSVAVLGVRGTLLAGLLAGAGGAGLLALGLTQDGSYAELLPGIVLLGLGQGGLWTGLWIAAATGVAPGDQGVASGMTSTALQVGGAVGLAALVGFAGPGGPAPLGAVRTAVFAIAAAIPVGLLAVLALRAAATRSDAEPEREPERESEPDPEPDPEREPAVANIPSGL
jgi:MFS family permease